MKLTPASRAFAMIRAEVASSVGPPNIMVPRQIGEIFRPLRPSGRYSIGWVPPVVVIPGWCASTRPQMCNCTSGNLEILRCAIAHRNSMLNASLRNDEDYVSFFNILNTPLAVVTQRPPAVTSVVVKIRLRVARITRGVDIRISPILALSMKWVSIWTVARVGLPDTYRAVMPEERSANVINSPPCTRPRRLWCLSWATIAYSWAPLTTRCHSGPTRLRNPLVSTMVQPEALSFSAAMSVVMSGLSNPGGIRIRGHFINRRRVVVKQDGSPIRRNHPPADRGALRGLCAAARSRAGAGAETGRGRHHAGRDRGGPGADGPAADPARGQSAEPSRSVGAAGWAV